MARSPSHSKKKATKQAVRGKAERRLSGDGGGEILGRIAAALERLAPTAPAAPDFAAAEAFVWYPEGRKLAAVRRVNRVEMSLLKGIDRVRDLLVENTERFARGLPANNALLWGARGMGKSSLVKAAHAAVGAAHPAAGLKLIEIHREDIESLPELMGILRGAPQRFIVFCDDLSFDAEDTSYKSLKTMLEWRTNAQPRSIPARRSRRRCRCRTASGCGSVSTAAARTNIWPWSMLTWPVTACRSMP
jgi:predicted AAA+ superfamily ATPase